MIHKLMPMVVFLLFLAMLIFIVSYITLSSFNVIHSVNEINTTRIEEVFRKVMTNNTYREIYIAREVMLSVAMKCLELYLPIIALMYMIGIMVFVKELVKPVRIAIYVAMGILFMVIVLIYQLYSESTPPLILTVSIIGPLIVLSSLFIMLMFVKFFEKLANKIREEIKRKLQNTV